MNSTPLCPTGSFLSNLSSTIDGLTAIAVLSDISTDRERSKSEYLNEILEDLAKKYGKPNASFLPSAQVGQFLSEVENWDKADSEPPF